MPSLRWQQNGADLGVISRYVGRMTFSPVLLVRVLALCVLFPPMLRAELPVAVAADDPLLVYSGRRDDSKPGEVRLGYSGARVRMAFEGEKLGMRMDSAKPNWVEVIIDGKRREKLGVSGVGAYYDLAGYLSPGVHTVEIVKVTEGMVGPVGFKGFALPEGGRAVEWPEKQTRRIEFVGDSITCGYGIEVDDPKLHFSPETENFCDSFAWLAARTLNADYLVVARSGIGMLRNYGGPADGSPDNMPAIYDRVLFHEPSLVWDHQRFTPDVVCINLGTNDFSGKGPDQEKYAANYVAFVKMLAGRYPSARVVLLMGPMFNGDALRTLLAQVAETVNKEHPGKVTCFELSKQGAHGFGADYHPSKAQAKINGAELKKYLSELMGWPVAAKE